MPAAYCREPATRELYPAREVRCGETGPSSKSSLRCLRDSAHGERRTLHDAENQRRPAVPSRCGVPRDLADRRQIEMFNSPAQRIRQQLLGKRSDELVPMADEKLPQPNHPVEFSAIGERRSGVDGQSITARAPFAERVEILQRKPERIHAHVTGSARRVLAMRFHTLANRERLIG